jgi:hypothetical protein
VLLGFLGTVIEIADIGTVRSYEEELDSTVDVGIFIDEQLTDDFQSLFSGHDVPRFLVSIPDTITCPRVFYHAFLRAIRAVLAHFFGIVMVGEFINAIHGMR